MKLPPKKFYKRLFTIILLAVVVLTAHPVYHLSKTYFNDKSDRAATPAGFADDASHLNKTKIDSTVKIASDSTAAENQLRELLSYARRTGKKISIAGAQHTMGGHTIYPNGIVLNMRGFKNMYLDKVTNILTVGSGALWSEIIPYLNDNGRSVIVMQSNNSFSAGGSVSVNCHGWQHNSEPISSTVESFRLMKSNGEVVTCSRKENPELFSLVLGGYGLFGIILDLKLKVTDNICCNSDRYIFPSSQYASMYADKVTRKKNVAMAYGRLDITPLNFLNEAILNVFIKNDSAAPPPLTSPGLAGLRREVFRGSIGSEYGKEFRWKAEKKAGEFLSQKSFSRNQLLNEGVEIYENRSAASTDILHEYFIPVKSFNLFIDKLKKIIPGSHADLLNITIRNVYKDHDTYLSYADQEVFGFVMLFNQEISPVAEQQMQKLTSELIDAALELGGRYYLPYRLHASREQFYHAYPKAADFFKNKIKYDPEEIFSNKFYDQYK